MTAALNSRLVGTLGLVAFGALAAGGYAADVPLRKGLALTALEHISEAHRLSRREIYEAIQSDLARRQVSRRSELQPGDLIIQSSVPIRKLGAGLRVKKITYDPMRRETAFELWASQEPEYLPFMVTTRRDPRALGLTVGPVGDPDARPEASSFPGGKPAVSKPAALAKPGRLATLVMYGQNVRLTTQVMPLQPGVLGQRILVRDPATARVMSAEVAGDGLLQTSF